jgi:hypothetical protein
MPRPTRTVARCLPSHPALSGATPARKQMSAAAMASLAGAPLRDG